MISAETTVGQLVAERPARSKVFEKLGIDYCCGGKRPLEQVCSEKGIDVASVLASIEAADQSPAIAERNWLEASLTSLADHIEETHHAYLRETLPRLDYLTTKVSDVHGDRRPELKAIREVFAAMKEELELHMAKEEQILFPMIRKMEHSRSTAAGHCGTISNPIAVMEHEHDSAGNALSEMNRLSNGYIPPEDACNTYRAMLDGLAELEADMHRHVHKENSILFPRAQELEASLLAAV